VQRSPLLRTLGAFAAFMGLTMVALHAREQRTFIPNVRMDAALAAGDGCVVLMGDSRMVAGAEPPALTAALNALGTDVCVATIAIGALSFPEQALAARRYLDAGRKPRAWVLGFSGDGLLPAEPDEPSQLAGNRAVGLAWSQASDVNVLYPGFPFSHLDMGLRFLLTRATPLGVYESVLWQYAQRLQDRLRGIKPTVRTPFGDPAEMRALAGRMRTGSKETLRAAARAGWPQNTLFFELKRRLAALQTPLVLVHMPMPSTYQADVASLPEMSQQLALLARDGLVLDLAAIPGLGDDAFQDGLHLTTEGSQRFCVALAQELRGALR
jgi:hypothetical protein